MTIHAALPKKSTKVLRVNDRRPRLDWKGWQSPNGGGIADMGLMGMQEVGTSLQEPVSPDRSLGTGKGGSSGHGRERT